MTRHQLKEQDEITTSLQRFTEFLYNRQKEIIAGACVLVVLAGAYFGWTYYASARDASAQMQLSTVITAYNDVAKPPKERYERAMAEAQKTYDAYSSHPVGAFAKYYLAMSQEGLGDTAKAVESLQDVIRQGGRDIQGIARFSLGGIYQKHGEIQKAIDTFKQLYDTGGYSKAAVGYELATLYEANNQGDQAKELYQKVISEFPDSPFRQEADEALKRLGVTAPPPKPS